jgi:putative peptidoglycan lipid II flippase
MGPLRHAGLALATAAAAMLNGGVLVAILNRRLGGVDWRAIGKSSIRMTIAAVPLVLACVWVAGAQVWTREGEWVAKTVMLMVGIGLSVTGYLAAHALMRSEELDVLWGIVKQKLGKGRGA